jgi:hypothetical protein
VANAGVEATTTIPDLSNLGGMLFDVERKVLTRYRGRMLAFLRGEWTGWKYQGRPVDAPRNVSFKAWKARVIVNTPSPELHIENAARSWDTGDDYVAYVRRRKGAEVEWLRLGREMETRFVSAMTSDLLAEVTKSIGSPTARRPLRTRGARPDTAVIATAQEL